MILLKEKNCSSKNNSEFDWVIFQSKITNSSNSMIFKILPLSFVPLLNINIFLMKLQESTEQ